MKPIPVKALKDDLRAWAVQYKDDVRLRRLYFLDDVKPISQKYYTVAKDGGGLVLVYQVADAIDLKAVDAEFAKLFARGTSPTAYPGSRAFAGMPRPSPAGRYRRGEEQGTASAGSHC